jgi:hypothetical protein
MSKSPFAGITSSAKRIDQPAVNNTSTNIPLEGITDRPGGDTRSLNQPHVEALAESTAIGWIDPTDRCRYWTLDIFRFVAAQIYPLANDRRINNCSCKNYDKLGNDRSFNFSILALFYH